MAVIIIIVIVFFSLLARTLAIRVLFDEVGNGPVVSGGVGVGGVIGNGVLVCVWRAVSNGACGWGFFSCGLVG